MSSFSSSHHGQTTKPRTKGVKPILRKLTSERNSIDLDRPAAEQDALGIYDYAGRSSHDQSGRRYQHRRNTSGTSQFSTDSGHRANNHPFAQTPYSRPFTPPAVSYQNSIRESEHSNSPVPTEDEESRHAFRSASNLSNHRTSSLNSSASPILPAAPLHRLQTKQPSLSRLALATSSTSLNNYLSSLSPDSVTPVDSMTPASNSIRTSFEKTFRVRSHSSNNEPRSRTESIVEARRKFQEKEMAKDEKEAREEVRLLEKRNEKEAKKIERGHRRSSASDATRTKRSKSDLTMQSEKGLIAQEYSSTRPELTAGPADGLDESGRTRSYTATATAKKKTHSAWTKFMMWFRTRFIRMGKKKTTGT